MIRGLPARWGACSRTVALAQFHEPGVISCKNNAIAVGLQLGDIVILCAVTGSQVCIFSGHCGTVKSVTFSLDGVFLASGSCDKTIKLWDVQTGGIIRTFSGHKNWVHSVSLSADSAMVASGSADNTICLWDTKTGECKNIIEQQGCVYHICFFPTNSQNLISISAERKVQQWNINGYQNGQESTGSNMAFSLDGTQFALCNESSITVQDTKSKTIVAKSHVNSDCIHYCCVSPDGRFIAASNGKTAYVWDTTCSDPHPSESFFEDNGSIYALVFSSPSTLISLSQNKSVKF